MIQKGFRSCKQLNRMMIVLKAGCAGAATAQRMAMEMVSEP